LPFLGRQVAFRFDRMKLEFQEVTGKIYHVEYFMQIPIFFSYAQYRSLWILSVFPQEF